MGRTVKIKLRVKEVATKKGLDRAKLARQADLTYETVHLLWNDPYRSVSMATLVKIARVLNVAVSELYEEVPDD
jgi:DNA-binding Xre family transcriptional regulator